MKLRLFSRVAVLCSAILHVACFTSTSSVTPSIHGEHDKELAIWFAPGITEVCLRLTGATGPATAHFELLDNTDQVVADVERTVPLRGDTHLTARLPVDPSTLSDASREALKWERLRYTVTADGKTSIRTVSVVDAMPAMFALRLTAPVRVEAGTEYRVAAHTSSPAGNDDAPGVTVVAVLKSGDATLSQAELKTDENGTASFAFPLKADSPEFASLVLNAFKDGAFQTQMINVRIEPMPAISISTDKPLYQPGQTIHCRTLLLGGESHRAMADTELKLILRNNVGETVATALERTDRFGVIAHDFKLADEVDLGDYTLQVETTTKHLAHESANIEVSRYELPSFSVAAEPNKTFYLVGEDARITLHANYLFGEAVEAGRVKIVADDATETQKRNSNATGFSGIISHGNAEIRVGPLRAPEKAQYQRQFVDRTYSAYVTDATSGRTEQTRFTLRVSREALHVYIRMADAIEQLPVQFCVSAYYPDGSPAQCDMTIDLDHGKYRSTVRSNQYGLAKVTTDYIAPLKKVGFYRKVSIKAQALDGRGQTGKTEQDVILYESERPRVATDRSLYRTGEEPLVTVLVPGPDRPVRLEAIKDGKVITAETLKPVDGRASTTLRWNSTFEGMVTLAAYEIEGPVMRWVNGVPIIEDRWSSYGTGPSTTNILFQPLTKLNVDVQLARGPLKPGEQADVEFHVTDAAGRPVETSLGVAVVDKAVSALSDANKDVRPDYLSDYLRSRWGYSEEVAGMKFSDLMALDFSRPISEDLSLVGELLLQRPGANLQRASAVKDFEPGALYKPLFSGMRERVAREVTTYFAGHQAYPVNTADLPVLSSSTDGRADLLDPWGVAYRFKMQDTRVWLAKWHGKESELRDWMMRTNRSVFTHTRTVVATSAGRDHLFGTTDDIEQQVMSFPAMPLTGKATAAIHGYVWGDGAPGAEVRARAVHLESGASFETVTQTGRSFKLIGLPPGMYTVTFESSKSNRLTLVDVIAAPGTQDELRFDLTREEEPPVVASTDQAVSPDVAVLSRRAGLSGLRRAIMTSIGGRIDQISYGEPIDLARRSALSASLYTGEFGRGYVDVVTRSHGGGGGGGDNRGDHEEVLETPRLRQHFPETLVWQPQIVTDATGVARLNFPVADSITTWQLAVVGSSIDGRLGSGSAEIRAFQDFIAEPQSPPVLTEGDEIRLPVVLRNYSEQSHAVRVTLDPADWFSLEGSNATQLDVAPNVAARADFRVRALTPGDFSTRVTAAGAAGSGAADAIERPVRVSRDGQEMITARGDLLDREAAYEFEIPSAAIPGSARAVVRLYPNLLAGALAAIEGMAQRPWGCLEQTLSSTYGNVLVLRYLKQHGRPPNSTVDWEKLERQARHNLEDGYQRVLSFPASNGGFSYFGDGEGDIALTAYALRFFADAREFIEIDSSKSNAAAQWLLRKQRPDGSWKIPRHFEDERPRYAVTAYVAGALAVSDSRGPELQRAFDYLDRNSNAMTDPYTLALYALATSAAGNRERERSVAPQLVSLALLNREGAHWQSPHRTLFYGWGGGGEIETTALVLQALAARENIDEPMRRLLNQGLLYLARTRDYQGSWHSTQATLLALQALMGADNTEIQANAAGLDLLVNGKPLKTVDVRGSSDASAIEIDLTSQLQTGTNHVELRAASGRLGVQLIYRYYVRWDAQQSNVAATDKLSLSVTADKEHAAVGEPVTYSVAFKRSEWQDSGMSILEIGLAPGADVDRATLQALLAGQMIAKYSITPNSLIFYVWPRSTSARFSFTVRPRLAMTAQTSPSLAYDYYNPDLRQAMRPSRLTVE